MQTVYHVPGHFRAVARPLWHHLRRFVGEPLYRALYCYQWQLRKLPRCVPTSVRFAGYPVRLCDAPSFLSAWDEIFVNRIYDIGELSHRPRLVDAGANIGLAALYWRWRYGEFDYLGFEPDPDIAAVCQVNLDAWGVGGSLRQCAVGPVAGTAQFLRDGADGGRVMSSSVRPRQAITVPVEELAPYLREGADLLKIDIEGAEIALIPSLAPVADRIVRIFIEWHCPTGEASGMGEAIGMLEHWGFLVHVQPVELKEHPFLLSPVLGCFRQQVNLYAVRQ